MRFVYTVVPHWPPLAWLAICRRGSKSIDVVCGSAVETTGEWFCEAVWDGPFSAGDFDQTSIVFGSGARLREDAVCFVSSMAPVDRLHMLRDRETTFVSNSLPCILQTCSLKPVRPEGGYIKFFRSIERGVEEYEKDLSLEPEERVGAGVVPKDLRLIYAQNLILTNDDISLRRKPADGVAFDSYEDYKSYLTERVVSIGENLRSTDRATAYDWLASMSRGFDSPTCAALALPAGLKRAVTYNEGRPGMIDDALAIGEQLGIETALHDRLAWSQIDPCEPLFVVADGQGKEISVASLGEELAQTVLLTGHGGGHLWRANSRTPGRNLSRVGYSGLSMTEFRLHRAFIHLPLAYIGFDREPEILRISLSDEMQPWRTPGEYDQPICVRVLQEAGVPRRLFGQEKTGLSIRFVIGQDSWSRVGKRRYSKWLWSNRRCLGLGVVRVAAIRSLLIAIAVIIPIRIRGQRYVRYGVRRFRDFLAVALRKLGYEDLAYEWAAATAANVYERSAKAD